MGFSGSGIADGIMDPPGLVCANCGRFVCDRCLRNWTLSKAYRELGGKPAAELSRGQVCCEDCWHSLQRGSTVPKLP